VEEKSYCNNLLALLNRLNASCSWVKGGSENHLQSMRRSFVKRAITRLINLNILFFLTTALAKSLGQAQPQRECLESWLSLLLQSQHFSLHKPHRETAIPLVSDLSASVIPPTILLLYALPLTLRKNTRGNFFPNL